MELKLHLNQESCLLSKANVYNNYLAVKIIFKRTVIIVKKEKFVISAAGIALVASRVLEEKEEEMGCVLPEEKYLQECKDIYKNIKFLETINSGAYGTIMRCKDFKNIVAKVFFDAYAPVVFDVCEDIYNKLKENETTKKVIFDVYAAFDNVLFMEELDKDWFIVLEERLEMFNRSTDEMFLHNIILKTLGEFIEVLKVTDMLHKAGFVHCDLKPENIGITKQGEMVLIDLDGAVEIDRRIHTYTIAYAPPVPRGELHWHSLPAKPSFDDYALGEIADTFISKFCPNITRIAIKLKKNVTNPHEFYSLEKAAEDVKNLALDRYAMVLLNFLIKNKEYEKAFAIATAWDMDTYVRFLQNIGVSREGALALAIKENNLIAVKKLKEKGFDKHRLFMWADVERLKGTMDEELNSRKIEKNKGKILFWAIENDEDRLAMKLLGKDVDVDQAFVYAITQQKYRIAEKLLAKGADEERALIWAIASHNEEAKQYLFGKGIRLNIMKASFMKIDWRSFGGIVSKKMLGFTMCN